MALPGESLYMQKRKKKELPISGVETNWVGPKDPKKGSIKSC